MNTLDFFKRLFAIIMRVLIVFVIAIILLCISGPLVNNYTARNLRVEIEKIPLPDNTEYIESLSIAGKLSGNGNGMQYLGVILIESELSLDDLEKHYSDFYVAKQDGQSIYFIHPHLPKFKHTIDNDNYYIVYNLGSDLNNIFSMFDLRGH